VKRRLLLAALAAAPALAAGAARAAEDKKKKAGGRSYLGINTLTGTINKPGGRRGVMTVECGLDVPDGGLRAKAESLLPVLRASYLQTVMTYAAGLPFGALPNADYLARTLQRQTDQTLGRPGARLLLGAILVN
jgi:hypothetical protein